jgi:hypothetical protein
LVLQHAEEDFWAVLIALDLQRFLARYEKRFVDELTKFVRTKRYLSSRLTLDFCSGGMPTAELISYTGGSQANELLFLTLAPRVAGR